MGKGKFGPWTDAIAQAHDGHLMPLFTQVTDTLAKGGYLSMVEDGVLDKLIDQHGKAEYFALLKLTPQYLIFAGKPKFQKILFLLAIYKSDLPKLTEALKKLERP